MQSNLGKSLPDIPLEKELPRHVPEDGGVASAGRSPQTMSDAVRNIQISIEVVIGSARMPLSEIGQLGPGVVITLDQKLGTPASILVNGRPIARGELFVLDGEGDRLGVTITEVLADRSPPLY